VGELFKRHNIIENRESQADDRSLLQIIITATYCTPQIKKFARLVMYNPCICITSFIEAIVFKSVRPQMYILKSIWKNKKISGKEIVEEAKNYLHKNLFVSTLNNID